jgi:23S rRNA (cytidine1920-2'-O)/16S rRNA (cytidine1409-2'-O)-methyltransferase
VRTFTHSPPQTGHHSHQTRSTKQHPSSLETARPPRRAVSLEGRKTAARGSEAGTVPGVQKQRVDTLLAERGHFASRSQAAASVMAGEVCVGPARKRAEKPGEMVPQDAQLHVRERPRYVSRGGVKLENALRRTRVEVAGRRALDVGASTGGFADCLLQHGAREVVAVDVGYGELNHTLRTDPRVRVLERTNARALTPDAVGAPPDLAVVDVSFISLGKVLPAVVACLAERFDVLALVKPQFEAPREAVGEGGVVRDAVARRAALVAVGAAVLQMRTPRASSNGTTGPENAAAGPVDAATGPPSILGFCSSGLPGPKGNRETFIQLAEPGRPGAATSVAEIEGMALREEP